MEACDDEQQPPEKKRPSMKYDTFKRWQSEFDPELTWLDSDCCHFREQESDCEAAKVSDIHKVSKSNYWYCI